MRRARALACARNVVLGPLGLTGLVAFPHRDSPEPVGTCGVRRGRRRPVLFNRIFRTASRARAVSRGSGGGGGGILRAGGDVCVCWWCVCVCWGGGLGQAMGHKKLPQPLAVVWIRSKPKASEQSEASFWHHPKSPLSVALQRKVMPKICCVCEAFSGHALSADFLFAGDSCCWRRLPSGAGADLRRPRAGGGAGPAKAVPRASLPTCRGAGGLTPAGLPTLSGKSGPRLLPPLCFIFKYDC